MDDFAAGLRREFAIKALLPLFFVSGGTALVYQTLWNRELHLVFGTSTFAIATVLAGFMCGLAVGGALMSRVADRVHRPLRVYGVLEIGIGLYALVFPVALAAVAPAYLWAHRVLAPGPVAFGLIQFTLVSALLLLPTAAMGATLPLLARFATARLGAAGDRIGTLYSVNTMGAVAGTALAGFWMLPSLGLAMTTWLAAAANLILGVGAVSLDAWASGSQAAQRPEVEGDDSVEFLPQLLPVSMCMAMAGFSSLVYEVAWTRLMGLMLGASVYAFSVMLLAFLVGIALGGKLGGPLSDRLLKRHGQLGVLVALAVTELSVGALSFGLMYVWPELPFVYVWSFDVLVSDPSQIAGDTAASQVSSQVWLLSLLLSGLVMTPPAVLMGIAFPLSVRAVLGTREALGGPVGRIYAWNTLGAVLGAFLAGFVLLPTIQVTGTVVVAVVVNCLAAAVCLQAALRASDEGLGRLRLLQGAAVIPVVLAVALPPKWDPLLMTAGMYHYVSSFQDHSREGIRSYAVDMYELLYYREGLSTVVTVAKNLKSGDIWLANNGKVDASTDADMPTQLLCALLPMQFTDSRDDVVVIGLASGITAGAALLPEDVGRLEIVELEPAIVEAARFFDPWNWSVLDDERVDIVTNDGRNHLLLAEPGSYDVIISEPSNPWITGVSNLFTREFWEMGKTRLKPGGVWSQWVQLYSMDDDDVKSLLHTFADVFPYVLVYETIEGSDLVLIGAEHPLEPSVDGALALLKQPKIADGLRRVGVHSASDLLTPFLLDREAVMEVAGNGQLNTDDNMRIEYRAPKNLHRDTQDANAYLLYRNMQVPRLQGGLPMQVMDLAEAYAEDEDLDRAVQAGRSAIIRLPPGDARRELWLTRIEEWEDQLDLWEEG